MSSHPHPRGDAGSPDAAPASEAASAATESPSGAAPGVIFGDIGTSPLYARQTLSSAEHTTVQPTPDQVLGAISLVLWSLIHIVILIVTLTDVLIVLRADHHGEGGVLSLATLVRRHDDAAAVPRRRDPVACDRARRAHCRHELPPRGHR